jgi:formate transporter
MPIEWQGYAMNENNYDSYAPAEIADRIERVGVMKAKLPPLPMAMLGILAGAFIGFGALFYVIVRSDAELGFATGRVLGGVAFSMGLLLVVVAGAELFTGNNLLAMAWADGRITTRELLRNWIVVALANFLGAAGLALLVWLSGHTAMNDGAIAEQVLRIGQAKCAASLSTLFWSGVLCNMLVCLALWMAMAGRSVTDKFIAIVFPISAFVAAGFEHSIANMYLLVLALMLKIDAAGAYDAITVVNILRNLAVVIAGNLLGGSVLVALVYYVIYGRRQISTRHEPE